MRLPDLTFSPSHVVHAIGRPSWPPSIAATAAIFLALLTFGLTLDAMLHPLAPFDRAVLRVVQAIELPGLFAIVHVVDTITNSTWAPIIWIVALTVFLVDRWWSAAMVTLLMPVGGGLNHLIGVVLVPRSRPAESDALRTIGDWDAPSFPSGHVLGAVMLYGFLLCLAPRFRHRLLRGSVSGLSIGVLGVVGFGRIWLGAHWPSDVLAAYLLGTLFVMWQLSATQVLDAGWLGPSARDDETENEDVIRATDVRAV